MSSTSIYCATCGAANPIDAERCFACGNPPLVGAGKLAATETASLSGALAGARSLDHLLTQRYRVRGQLGTGGFGAVYQAEDTELGNRLVAIKAMSQRGLTPEELQEVTKNFHREALLLAGLSHPNLPHIYEQFEEQGRWYLVMEYIQGETLEARLSRAPGGCLPVEEVLRIGLELSKVLGYLHTHQPPIIFRDLKPANVMLTAEGHVFLIDFGIARLFKPGQTRDTESFGSAGYAAPEQYGKAQTTTQSDIYGLGATLHHLLSGDDPSDHPFLFKPLHLAASPELEALMMHMLKQDTSERPATIYLVGQELERIAEEFATGQKRPSASTVSSSLQMSAASKISPASIPPTAQPTSLSASNQMLNSSARRPMSRSRKVGLLSTAGVLVFGLVVGLLAYALTFHQEVKTSDAVPDIHVGTGYDFMSQTLQVESESFQRGDTVSVVFVIRDSIISSLTVKLSLGTKLEQSDTIPASSFSYLVTSELDTSQGPVSGTRLEDHATINQADIYKWEIDDYQGNAQASITFQVT